MKIIEDISYSIDDVVERINDDYGFTYTEETPSTGYIILGNGIRLEVEFEEEERKLKSALLKFPDHVIDLVKSQTTAELYATSIESASQIVDLINLMLGGGNEDA